MTGPAPRWRRRPAGGRNTLCCGIPAQPERGGRQEARPIGADRPEDRKIAADCYDKPLEACAICKSRHITRIHEDFRGNQLWKCAGCGVEFMNPQYSDAYLNEYYGRYHPHDIPVEEYLVSLPDAVGVNNFYFSLIEKHVPPGKLLDFGCGQGVLLHIAQKRGWTAYGYEIDCEVAARVARKLGVPISCGDAFRHEIQGAPFRAILLNQVLEHVREPGRLLVRLFESLEDEGVLFVATPNISSFSNTMKYFMEKIGIRKRKVGNYYATDHHLWYFSPRTLSKTLQLSGFEVIHESGTRRIRKNQTKLAQHLRWHCWEKRHLASGLICLGRKRSQET